LERNWKRLKGEDKTRKRDEPTSFSRSRNFEGGGNVRYTKLGY